jgi:hypothetical protein
VETVKVSQEVKLGPKEIKKVILSPDSYPQLIIKNPRLWWTSDLGQPELYFLILSFKMAPPRPTEKGPEQKKEKQGQGIANGGEIRRNIDIDMERRLEESWEKGDQNKKETVMEGKGQEGEEKKEEIEKPIKREEKWKYQPENLTKNDTGQLQPEQKPKRLPFGQTPEIASDWRVVRFGIREVSDYFNEAGHRGYGLNGRQVLIRGGGWVDDIFLNVKPKKLLKEILYVRHLNLNALRLEGFWGTGQTFYDFCDENGILVLAGWRCQWEWENLLGKPTDREFGGIISPEDISLIAQSFRDQVRWLRNHPSILVWLLASDLLPKPELE